MTPPTTKHPTSEQLRRFGLGELGAEEQARVEEHVALCDHCCRALQHLPDDTLLANLKNCGTAIPETIDSEQAAAWKAAVSESGIPVELVDHPRYRIIQQLGQGGMGVVYQAEHRLMQRSVALKVINQRLVRSATAVERFRFEVRAAAKLSHPNIVTAHDAEQAGNIHFLVMEFVEGTDLARQVRKSGPLPVRHACHFVRQAACGLQQAFERGMVHRDIKPQNLMLTREGRIKILDFGLARLASEVDVDSEAAKLTKHGMLLGTPDYMAPEQILDARQADIRADIYSLGCTLYYLLVGHVPFPDGSPVDKMTAHLKTSPPEIGLERTDLPPGLSDVVGRMLAKDVNKRYQTPQELADALQPFCKSDAASQTEISAEPPGPSAPAIDLLAMPLAPAPNLPSVAYAPRKDRASLSRRLREQAGWPLAAGVAVLLVGICLAAIGPIRRALTTGGFGQAVERQGIEQPLAVATGQNDAPTVASAPGARPRVAIVLPRDQLWYPDYGEVAQAFGNRAELVGVSSRRGLIHASDGTPAMMADLTLDGFDPANFDALIFLGALQPDRNLEFLHRNDYWQPTHDAIEAMLRDGKCVAALCAGNAVLAEHGALDGKRAAWTNYIPMSYRTRPGIDWHDASGVVAAGNVITATSSDEAGGLVESVLAVTKR